MRYLLFKFKEFYPAGGALDFVRAFASLDSAISYASTVEDEYQREHWNVLDLSSGKVCAASWNGVSIVSGPGMYADNLLAEDIRYVDVET